MTFPKSVRPEDECAQSPKADGDVASPSSAAHERTPSSEIDFSSFERGAHLLSWFLSARLLVHDPAQLLRPCAAGLPAPQIDEQHARHGHNGPFARSFMGPGI
jgi:hypothetical protein